MQAPHVESLTQDQRLLLADPAGESDNIEAARETFVYLWQYLQSLESEVSCCSTSLPTWLILYAIRLCPYSNRFDTVPAPLHS